MYDAGDDHTKPYLALLVKASGMGEFAATLRPPAYAFWVQTMLLKYNRQIVIEVYKQLGWNTQPLGLEEPAVMRTSIHDEELTLRLDTWPGILPNRGKLTFNAAIFHGEGSYEAFAQHCSECQGFTV